MGSRGNYGDNKIKLLGMFVGRTFLFWAHDSLCTFSFYTKHSITACLCRRGSYVYSIFLSCSVTPSVLFFSTFESEYDNIRAAPKAANATRP